VDSTTKDVVVITLKKGLLTGDCLGLEIDCQHLFVPYAGGYIYLYDGNGNKMRCRVNARVTMLEGKGLTDFLSRLGAAKISIQEQKIGQLLVTPLMQKKAADSRTAKPVDQLLTPIPESAKTTRYDKKLSEPVPVQAPVKETPLKRQARPKQTKTAFAKQPKGSTRAVKTDGANRRGREKTPVEVPEMITKTGTVAGKIGIKKPMAAVNQGGKMPRNGKVSSTAMDNVSEQITNKPIENTNITEPIAGKKDFAKNLNIRFFPDEDVLILNKTETTGQITLYNDLLLRRRALQLSLSPGFDTLLSLSAVRNVQALEYQQQTVRHVLRNLRGRALLCDEVGLGKTVEAGLIMMEYLLRGLVRRVLILTPPTLVEQWREEMHTKFNLNFITYDSASFKSEPNPWSAFPHIIASLDTAKRENHRRQVLDTEYDLVIVDEAHHLKNSRTKAYQLVGHLKKKYILLLTATPVENDLSELFNLITLLLPGQLETSASFKRKYITRGDPLKVKNSTDLKRLVREVMVRNRRSETGAIACQRQAEVIEVNLSQAEKTFYQRLTTFVRGYYTPGADMPTAGVNRFVLKMLQREAGSSLEALVATLDRMSVNDEQPAPLRRVLNTLAVQAREIKERSKADTLVRLLEQINEQVVVFTSFRETQRSLAALLRDRGFKIAELHGDMRRLEKEKQIQLFMGDARVLVATETGSEGRNLQFCRNLINYDLPWNPMRIEQRIGRIHRLGQTRNVFIYNLSTAGTIESYILELLDAKINMFQLVIGELDMILGNLKEKREFEDIVMDIWFRYADEQELKQQMDDLGEELIAAREHYRAVKELDDRLLGELLPDE